MGEYANKAMGKTKKVVGRATGNRSLQARGTVQEYAGKAQGGVRKASKGVRRATRNASKRPKRSSRKATTRSRY